ncbi:acyltransferase family protein [Actinopolymorpha pittospori]
MTTRSDTHGVSEPPRARRATTSQVLDESVTAPRRTRGRLFFVDNLRVYLTILVLAHHLAITYGNIPAWTYLEPPSNPAEGAPLDLLVGLNQVYFMGFFFLLSGYFTPRSFDTKGARRFSLDRLRRLGIPLLGFLFLLRPLYTLPTYFAIAPDERPSYALYYVLSFDPGPLWFVEVLLVFALGYALVRTWRPAPAKVVDEQARPPRVWAVLGYGVVLGAVSFLWRMLVPVGTYIPVVGLPSAAYLPQYLSLFAVGVLAYRRNWFHRLPGSYGWLGGAVMLVASIVFVPLMNLDASAGQSARGSAAFAQAMWDALFSIGAILVLFTAFRRFLDRRGRLGGFLARNAFAVYVIHPVVLVAIGVSLRGLDLNHLLKFAVTLAIAVPVTWALAAAVRRLPVARDVL